MTYSITVQPSGRAFVARDDETILAAAIRQGVAMPYGCRDGACGSCKCRVLEGRLEQRAHQPAALSAQERSAGYVLACCSVALGDLVLESRQTLRTDALPVRSRLARVVRSETRSPDVRVLTLQLPVNDPMPYRAGQYLDVLLRDGSRRSYSMANAPSHGPQIELHLRHMPGGRFTDRVFGAMKEREILRVEGPYGSFFLRDDTARPIVLLASGTGFAPIKAVIEQMLHSGITRPAVLYWGGRRPADLYLADWVRARSAEWPGLGFVPVVSDALPEDRWAGRTGFVHHAVIEDFPDLSAHQVYVCGAPVVVESARRDFIGRCHLPEDEFFADAFTTEKDKASARTPVEIG